MHSHIQSVLVHETQSAQYHIDRASTIIFRLPQKVARHLKIAMCMKQAVHFEVSEILLFSHIKNVTIFTTNHINLPHSQLW